MRITSKGQVTIPQAVREALGLLPHTEVDFIVEDGAARLVKATTQGRKGRKVVEQLLGSGDVPLTTDQIMAMTRGPR